MCAVRYLDYEYSGNISPQSTEMSKYTDVFRRTGADITYFRKYEKDGGEEILLRSERFEPHSKVSFNFELPRYLWRDKIYVHHYFF